MYPVSYKDQLRSPLHCEKHKRPLNKWYGQTAAFLVLQQALLRVHFLKGDALFRMKYHIATIKCRVFPCMPESLLGKMSYHDT
jgi:hypothetical protein